MSRARDITSELWSMANRLRGTMDASEYKNYILPFIFYRYLSENQDEYLRVNSLEEFYDVPEEELEDYLIDISRGIGYVIEPEYTWGNLINKIENHQIVASDFQEMFDSFNANAKRNPASEKDFANIFSDVNLGDTRLGSSTNERAKALNDIALMINDFSFIDDSGKDILGDVYEYLIGEFAANAGKKGGEFYTPQEVSQVLAKVVTAEVSSTDRQFRVYDPAMGSGSLMLTVQKEFPGSNEAGSVDFYGQEINTTTYNIARMNLMMHGVNYRNMNLRRADTLATDWPFDEIDGIQTPMKFDAVVANPPYSQKWDNKTIDRNKDPRFKNYGVAPASRADFAFVLHGLYHLDENGTMAVVLPHGVLFRGGQEAKIRKNLLKNNLLDTVIGLPANLFYGTGIPTCILVFKGSEARGNNKDVLFIDASDDFVKAKNKNRLSEENIAKIVDTYKQREEIEKYSHIATEEEIKENDYNLNIPRYVDTFEEEEITPLPELLEELAEVRQEIDETTEKLMTLFADLEGTNEESQKELLKLLDFFK